MNLPKPVKFEVERYVEGLSKFKKIDNPIKLSANESALGASPKAIQAIEKDKDKSPNELNNVAVIFVYTCNEFIYHDKKKTMVKKPLPLLLTLNLKPEMAAGRQGKVPWPLQSAESRCQLLVLLAHFGAVLQPS